MPETVEEEIRQEETELEAGLKTLLVTDQAGYEAANELIGRCDAALKKIADHHDPVIKAAHEAHRAALEAKKRLADPVTAIRADASRKMTAWYTAEKARLADERRRAEEEARRQAEEERRRTAAALEKAGMKKAAEAALKQPVEVKAPQAAGPVKAEGVSYRTAWKIEVTGLMELVRAIAAGSAPLTYVEANMTSLSQAVRAFRGTQAIPGCRQYEDTIQAKRK
jgi:membrane protein involved in colicin uptake